jgi:hypothetical protein
MKFSAKIIVYCLWIGFLIWFSNFGSSYFSEFASFIKRKVFGDISPSIDFAMAIIPWNIFISLLLWLPILFLRQRRIEAAREIFAGVIFFFSLVMINLFSILIWCVYFPESIGDFSGSFSMLEQYAVSDGWTPLQFKAVWWMYTLFSTAFSLLMAFCVSQIKKEGIVKTLSS